MYRHSMNAYSVDLEPTAEGPATISPGQAVTQN
jgi:hypothetical protein